MTFRSVWEPQQRSMQMAIPILMEKQRMQRQDAMIQEQIKQAEAARQARLQEAQMKLADDAFQARMKYNQEMMKEMYKSGDAEGVRAFGEPLRQQGLPVPAREAQGPSMPGQGPPLEYFAAPQKGPQLTGDAQNLSAIFGRPPTLEELQSFKEGSGKDEFSRNLSRLVKLESEGKKGTREHTLLAKRIAKQTEETTGLAIQFGEDGTFTLAQGPGAAGGLGSALTGQQAITQQSQLDRYNSMLDTIDTVTGLLEEDPSRSGLTGSVRSFAQRIVGVAGDATPAEISETAKRTLAQMRGIPADQRENIMEFFDPALPELEIYQNTIALELAKLRVTSGGGGIRAIESAFRAAREDAAIFSRRGKMLFSTQEALTRYKTIRSEFETERDSLRQRLGGKSQKSQPTVIKYDAQGNRLSQ